MGCEKCGGSEEQYCNFCKPIKEIDSKPIVQTKETEFGHRTIEVLKQHSRMLHLHYNTIGCHCECLGMASENLSSEVQGKDPEFKMKDFGEAMQKWGLVDKKGKPIL